MSEQINNPSHYGGANNPYEAIKVIAAWGLGFCLGNTVKYISRAGKKDGNSLLQDLKKALWYLNFHIRQLDQNFVENKSNNEIEEFIIFHQFIQTKINKLNQVINKNGDYYFNNFVVGGIDDNKLEKEKILLRDEIISLIKKESYKDMYLFSDKPNGSLKIKLKCFNE